MRPVLKVVAVSLLLGSSARAADLTRALLEYLTTKTPPSESSYMSKEVYVRIWTHPLLLNADAIMLTTSKNNGIGGWFLVIINPRLPISDYLGSNKVVFLETQVQPKKVNVFRVDGGRLRGFYIEDGIEDGNHMLAIFTPAMAAKTRGLSKYIK
ncbi:hypothetical protein [Deinococcus ruber]|uniref:Uncharacterized protein n=1 Tax=Deinococcus ruber TaxID=1848197 RepID=A0A918CCY0_9DEIO|nr:hypothetical protein [Deinococcus ruber]GGR14585.1 hypothetical protein GCM10008957_29250 [Deinococcus ruber]